MTNQLFIQIHFKALPVWKNIDSAFSFKNVAQKNIVKSKGDTFTKRLLCKQLAGLKCFAVWS